MTLYLKHLELYLMCKHLVSSAPYAQMRGRAAYSAGQVNNNHIWSQWWGQKSTAPNVWVRLKVDAESDPLDGLLFGRSCANRRFERNWTAQDNSERCFEPKLTVMSWSWRSFEGPNHSRCESGRSESAIVNGPKIWRVQFNTWPSTLSHCDSEV